MTTSMDFNFAIWMDTWFWTHVDFLVFVVRAISKEDQVEIWNSLSLPSSTLAKIVNQNNIIEISKMEGWEFPPSPQPPTKVTI